MKNAVSTDWVLVASTPNVLPISASTASIIEVASAVSAITVAMTMTNSANDIG